MTTPAGRSTFWTTSAFGSFTVAAAKAPAEPPARSPATTARMAARRVTTWGGADWGLSRVGGAAQQRNPLSPVGHRRAVTLGEGRADISQYAAPAGCFSFFDGLVPLDGLRLRSVLLVAKRPRRLLRRSPRRLRRRGIADAAAIGVRVQRVEERGRDAPNPCDDVDGHHLRPGLSVLLVPGVPVPCAVKTVGVARGPSRGGGRSRRPEERAQRPECQERCARQLQDTAA